MYSKLIDVKNGKIENHILPFLWMKGEDISLTLRQLYRAHEAGIGAVCLESRTFEDFGGETWWQAVTRILDEAGKLDMKVWILDDKHFPTGYANGLIEKKYPEKRPKMLCEKHIDVLGPGENEWLLKPFGKGDECLGIFAVKRAGRSERELTDEIIEFPVPEGGIAEIALPEGCWRVFALWQTQNAGCFQPNYIDMMDADSVAVQIEAVYEPHWQQLSKYFGHTLAGFFSDEPCIGSDFFIYGNPNGGFYDRRTGDIGLGMPWHRDILAEMSTKLGRDARPLLPLLWFDSPLAAPVRVAYMDTVAERYENCFTNQLGSWCRAHGVEYIGHIIEDNDAHTTTGRSGAHYFRALGKQDMAGIDIVLHQVMPGLADWDNSTICAAGVVSSTFNHYTLAKLASSLADITPEMKGRAMCEVFGAYGWAEGVSMMKWLMDFLLVRGVNRFVPHAFSPIHPNPDCPPHFDADGTNPQFEDFACLMRYTNAVSNLLDGKRVNRLAVLYHAEADWSGRPFTNENDVAAALTDAHIDFDIVPSERLTPAGADGKLRAGNAAYDAFIVPYAEFLPESLKAKLNSLGVPLFETDAVTEGLNARALPLAALAEELTALGYRDITVEGDNRLLRVCAYDCGDARVYMLFNEYTERGVKTCIQLPDKGSYIALDLLGGKEERRFTENGAVDISLSPYESVLLIFDGAEDEPVSLPAPELTPETCDAVYDVYLADADSLEQFQPFAKGVTLKTMPRLPEDFGGQIKYITNVASAEGFKAVELENVSDTACVSVNGGKPVRRICAPFVFSTAPYARKGENQIEITVSTTLARRVRDDFSAYIPMKKFGFTKLKLLK